MMRKYHFNDSVIKIDPRYLEEGVRVAEEEQFESIRIKAFVDDVDFKCDLDLAPLKDKKFIKHLAINNNFKLKSVANIEALYSLVNMIDFRVSLQIPIDFSRLKQLEELYLFNSCYENLETLTNLKSLYIFGYSKQNCHELRTLKELVYLRLSGSKKLESLEGVEDLENLETCWLAKNNCLSEANSISKLSRLEWLHVEGCKNLMDYSFLNDNGSIKKLLISDLASLEFVKTMSALETINFWNCKSGDLTPLLECPTLKEVSFHPQKKHYSHKRDTINNLLKNKS
ncbi:hypothetical protein ACVWXS_002773 [Lysinibacillus sp. TE18511]